VSILREEGGEMKKKKSSEISHKDWFIAGWIVLVVVICLKIVGKL